MSVTAVLRLVHVMDSEQLRRLCSVAVSECAKLVFGVFAHFPATILPMQHKRYSVVGLGGTFDHFHAGHEAFLEFAGRLANRVVIGITADHMTAHKPLASTIEPLQVRQRSVKHFCQKHSIKSDIEVLHNIFGSTLDERTPIEALVVTAETLSGAEKINETRIQLHQPPFPILNCALVKDDSGQELHSERIRAGQVSRTGKVYSSVFDHTIVLNERQRNFFRKPHGDAVSLPSFLDSETVRLTGKRPYTAVVGDVSLGLFLQNNWPFDLGIYDGLSQRAKYDSKILLSIKPTLTCANPAGSISFELVKALSQVNKQQRSFVYVDGEEDLATVALLLLLPLNSVVFYGDPKGVMREVEVDEVIKSKVFSILIEK